MIRASLTIHIPSRTVLMDDVPCPAVDEDKDYTAKPFIERGTTMSHCNPLSCQKSVRRALRTGKEQPCSTSSPSLTTCLMVTLDARLTEHAIDRGDAKPINLPPYRTSPAKKRLIEEQVEQMLPDGIIEPSTGPWAAPVVIVNGLGSDPRFCVDYRGVNQVTQKDSYPLLRVDESLDFLVRGQFITTLDLARGYWQVASGSCRGVTTKDSLHISLRSLPVSCSPLQSLQRTSNISETDEQCTDWSHLQNVRRVSGRHCCCFPRF